MAKRRDDKKANPSKGKKLPKAPEPIEDDILEAFDEVIEEAEESPKSGKKSKLKAPESSVEPLDENFFDTIDMPDMPEPPKSGRKSKLKAPESAVEPIEEDFFEAVEEIEEAPKSGKKSKLKKESSVEPMEDILLEAADEVVEEAPPSKAVRKSKLKRSSHVDIGEEVLHEPMDTPAALPRSEVIMGEPITGFNETMRPDSGPASGGKRSEVIKGEPISGMLPMDYPQAIPPRPRRSEVVLGGESRGNQPPSELLSGVRLSQGDETVFSANELAGDPFAPKGADSSVSLPHKKGKKKSLFEDSGEINTDELIDEVLAEDVEPASGVDLVAEELESKTDSQGSPLVEFDDDFEGASPSKKKLKKSKKADEEELFDLAETEGELAEAVEDGEEVLAEDALEEEVAEEAEEAVEGAEDVNISDLLDEEAADEVVDAEDALEEVAEEEVAEEMAEEDGSGVNMFMEDGDGEEEDSDKKKKKKKKKSWDDDDHPSPRFSGPQYRPNLGARWFGGTILGLFLAAAGAAGVWFLRPDIIGDLLVQSPNHKVDPSALALKSMVEKKYDKVEEILKDSADDKDKLLRGDALLRKYQERLAINKLDPNPEDPEAKQIKSIFNAINDPVRVDNFNRFLDDKNNREAAKTVKDLQVVTGKDKHDDIKDFVKGAVDVGKSIDEVRAALVEVEHIAKKDDFKVDVFKTYLKDLTASKKDLDMANKILKDGGIADAGSKGVETAIMEKAKLDEVNKILDDEKIAKKNGDGVKDLIVLRNDLKKDRDDLDQTVKDAFKEFEDGKIAVGDPRKELVNRAKIARLKAESPLAIPLKELGTSFSGLGSDAAEALKTVFDRTARETELAMYASREPFVVSPEQRLDAFADLYLNRDYKKDLDQATKVSTWVLEKQAAASPEAKGKAHMVLGLAARNTEKYDEARKSLNESVQEFQKIKTANDFPVKARGALLELSDPTLYYLPKAREHYKKGLVDADLELKATAAVNFQKGLEDCDVALRVMPNDPQVLVQRGLAKLQWAKVNSKGRFPADIAAEIRRDGDAGVLVEKTKAEATFLLGLLEEQLGNYPKAEEHLRAAIAMGSEADKGRYRLALGKILQRDRPNNPFPEEFKAPEPKIGQGQGKPARISYLHPAATMLAALSLGQANADEDENPNTQKRLNESLELAREMIKSDQRETQGQGYLLLGKAYARQGRKTEALKEYAKGMKILHGSSGSDLLNLLEDHPAFQIPDSFNKPNPYMAEQAYGKGLHYFWIRDFAGAETQFKQAVSFYPQDARYQYFLGLTLLTQNVKSKRDLAIYSIEQGARLEASNRPGSGEVNSALERLQGDMRQMLNSYRARALNSISN